VSSGRTSASREPGLTRVTDDSSSSDDSSNYGKQRYQIRTADGRWHIVYDSAESSEDDDHLSEYMPSCPPSPNRQHEKRKTRSMPGCQDKFAVCQERAAEFNKKHPKEERVRLAEAGALLPISWPSQAKSSNPAVNRQGWPLINNNLLLAKTIIDKKNKGSFDKEFLIIIKFSRYNDDNYLILAKKIAMMVEMTHE
jgi:hypothetical protein